jgi:hypothetical protein
VDPARDSPVYVAPPADWVGRVQVDKGRLVQEPDRQVKLVRDALWRHVAVARPHNVLNVEAVVLSLVALPDANLF